MNLRRNKMYYYTMFYQNIACDFEIKEAISISKPEHIDIYVEEKEPPQEVFEQIEKGYFDGITKDKSWIYVKDLVIYYIENGNHILVHTLKSCHNEMTKVTFLTGLGMAMALTQKGYVPMHGGALCVNDGGYIVTGDSGSGKSSTMTQLRAKGGVFMADDLAVIDCNSMDLLPGFPVQKLCGNMVDKLELDKSELIYIGEARDKYEQLLSEDEYLYEKRPLKGIFQISKHDGDELKCYEVIGNEKLKIIANNIFCIFFVKNFPMDAESMMKYLRIAQEVKVYRIERPEGKDTLDSISEYCYQKMLQNC